MYRVMQGLYTYDCLSSQPIEGYSDFVYMTVSPVNMYRYWYSHFIERDIVTLDIDIVTLYIE
jgi:hypothetical protein